ncbi:MAG: alpha/beta hydrolase [Alphaproteobacteria bacterium]
MTTDLHYQILGNARGRTLVLLHGLGSDGRMWRDAVALLGERYRIVVYDRRGAGRSPRATEPQTLERELADLEAVLDAAGVTEVVPVGCAMGTMVAATFAARHPGRVPALVLSTCGLRVADGRVGDVIRKRAGLVLKAASLGPVLPAAVEVAFNGLPLDDRYRAFLAAVAENDPQSYANILLGSIDHDISTLVQDIGCPTLVLAGRLDRGWGPGPCRAVFEALPNASFVVVEKAAHFIPYQAPTAFARLVDGFVAGALGD